MSSSHVISLDIVLNELSFEPPTANIYGAWPWMNSLTETLRTYMSIDPAEIKSLLTTSELMRIPLAERYTISAWCNDEQVPSDDRTFFLGLSTQKPFVDRGQMECHFQGRFAEGLTIAWRDSLPTASAHSAEHWNTPHLDIETTVLNDAGDDYISQHVQLCHACQQIHVPTHVGWIRDRIRDIQTYRKTLFRSGRELWDKREQAFPHLALGDDILRQIFSIRNGDERIVPIAKRLFELEKYCDGWNEGAFDSQLCPGNPRQDGDVALQKYAEQRTFRLPGGEKHLFSWHVSAYIDGWRIYFEPVKIEDRPNNRSKRMVIGYIGSHLDTKKY
ncbi:MAG: hypothetical protein WCI67_00570 [Chloroflexales bacterium]